MDSNSSLIPIHSTAQGLKINQRELCVDKKIRESWDGDLCISGSLNLVQSLLGCPRVVTNTFSITAQSHLFSLVDSPEKAKRVEIWNCLGLKDLRGITQARDSYAINSNNNLLSLDGISINREINIFVYNNRKLSVTQCFVPLIKTLTWINNQDDSLHDFHRHFPQINELIISDHIKSRMLSVLLIKGLQKMRTDVYSPEMKTVISIINQHLPNTLGKKGMLRCQAELIDAGYTEHAQL